MVAVTSIMRVHQILIGRLNELLEPFGLTFPRYEALMLLFSAARLAAAGQDRRAPPGPPDQRHQHDRRAGEDRPRAPGPARVRPPRGPRRDPPRGREVAEQATEALNERRLRHRAARRGAKLKELARCSASSESRAGDFPG